MYLKANHYRRVLIKKILFSLPVTAILLFSVCLTATAGGQTQSITISANNVKLEKIFSEIKKQTNYVFFYDAHVLRDTKPVSIHVKNGSIEEVLKESLRDQPLDFSIEKETITIFKKAASSLDKISTVAAAPPIPHLLNEIRGIVKDEKGNPLLQGDNKRRFFEASWVHKYNGKYYFSYSTGDTHFICYAIGDNPYGPFTYAGRILEPVVGWTSHHSIVEFNGEWYLFYHDSSLSKGVTHLRNIKVTKIAYDENGFIKTIKPYGDLKALI